jgi:pectate lyase
MIWKVVDGELECSRWNQWSAEIVTGEASWTDYTIEADVKLLQDHGAGDFDIVARVTTADNGYGFLVGDWVGEPSVYVQRLPDLNMKVIEPFDPLELNIWHHIKLEAEGNRFSFWVNNEKVIEYQDDTYQKGMVGFGVANYTARFDNVIITGSDVPDVMLPTRKGQLVEPRGKLATTWASVKISF